MSQTKWIEIETVHNYIAKGLEGVMLKEAWGEASYFYNPGSVFVRGSYFATIKQKDGENDRASHLDRDGAWRLNMGVSKAAYFGLFGLPPSRPGKGGLVEGDWDFTARDQLTPHPVYGWMSWVSVLNPSDQTWQRCMVLLSDAYQRAQKNFEKRQMKRLRTPRSG